MPPQPASVLSLVSAFVLVAAGGAGSWALWHFNVNAQAIHLPDATTFFAVLFAFATAIERVLEPFARFLPGKHTRGELERAVANLTNAAMAMSPRLRSAAQVLLQPRGAAAAAAAVGGDANGSWRSRWPWRRVLRAWLGSLLPEFRIEDDRWRLDFAGRQALLPDAEGMLADIAALLGAAGRQVHVFTLFGSELPALGADPVLDRRAATALRERLNRLAEETDDAERDNDLARPSDPGGKGSDRPRAPHLGGTRRTRPQAG